MMNDQPKLRATPDTPSVRGKHIKELLVPGSGHRIGFKVGGNFPGPNALVSGYAELTKPVYQRLLLIPTLAWMRGTLFLITLERLDQLQLDANLLEIIGADGPVDDQVTLPSLNTTSLGEEAREKLIRHGYNAALQLCARLGMISGRGVSLSDPTAPNNGSAM